MNAQRFYAAQGLVHYMTEPAKLLFAKNYGEEAYYELKEKMPGIAIDVKCEIGFGCIKTYTFPIGSIIRDISRDPVSYVFVAEEGKQPKGRDLLRQIHEGGK